MFKMRAFLSSLAVAGALVAAPFGLAHADQVGHASWYALHSRTASGEMMNPSAMTAAHRTLPFGTQVRVENLNNGRSVVVRINDRGPFVHGRIIDVSKAAAANLGMLGSGTANVRISTSGRSTTKSNKNAPKILAKNSARVAAEKPVKTHSIRGGMGAVARSGLRDKDVKKTIGDSKKRTVIEASDKKQYGIFAGGLFNKDKSKKGRVASN